jgi:tripeptide aminopeptidase
VAAIEKAFVEAARSIKSSSGAKGAVRFEGHLDYDSFRLSQKEPCVKAAAAAIQSLGWEPEWAIANGGLDANWMTARGIPTVSMGCGQLAIHTVNEQLDIAEFERACRVALRLATGEA